ncbi:MAG TPA: hypothetical protein VLJ68_03270 [Chitinophagaceae bacterium]|nr:hypothetical protein [Chitinophagaceae bacterium]
MKKYICTVAFVVVSSFLFVQGQPSALNCSDINENLITLKGSIDNLDAYKKQQTSISGSQHFYSTDFTVCNVKGKFWEMRINSKTDMRLSFHFDLENKADFGLRHQHVLMLLEEIKKVFADWELEEESEDHGNIHNYDFTEKGYPDAKIKRMVSIIEYAYYNDDYSIALEFSWRNY